MKKFLSQNKKHFTDIENITLTRGETVFIFECLKIDPTSERSEQVDKIQVSMRPCNVVFNIQLSTDEKVNCLIFFC